MTQKVTMPLVRPDLPKLSAITRDLESVWSTGRVSNFGPYTEQLEAACTRYFGCGTLTSSSATAALTSALIALEIPKGSKVIIPSFTFAATAQAVLCADLSPIFCDADDDGNLSAAHLESILARRSEVRAVVPVHLYGTPANVEAIGGVVRTANSRKRLRTHVIYDAAHAFGARANGAMVGTFGDAEVFSFSATKPVVGCEGGLVTSHNRRYLDRLRRVRNYGLKKDNLVAVRGLNGKMSEIHALIALHNVWSIEARIRRRVKMAAHLRNAIQRETPFVCLPVRASDRPSYKDFTIRIPRSTASRRGNVIRSLRAAGIDSRVYFTPPLHRQAFFREYAEGRLPVTDSLSRSVLTIPFYTQMTSQDLDRLIFALARA